MTWSGLRFDPERPQLRSADPVIRLRAEHELNGRPFDTSFMLSLPPVRKTISKQGPDGSWRYPGSARTGPGGLTI
jgi:hypothetical protein